MRNKTPLVMQSGSRQGPQTLKYERENCNKLHALSTSHGWKKEAQTDVHYRGYGDRRLGLPGLQRARAGWWGWGGGVAEIALYKWHA